MAKRIGSVTVKDGGKCDVGNLRVKAKIVKGKIRLSFVRLLPEIRYCDEPSEAPERGPELTPGDSPARL